jgi:hypothetical protein
VIVADQAAIDYCLTALEDAGLFPKVNYRSSSGTNKDVALISIEFNQKQHLNAGGNMTKVFFIGFTLFLLTPALPMTYGFESDMTATIHFADGEEVVCRKKATGKCYYNFVYPADLAMQGTRAKVVGENYKALTPDLIKSLPLSQPQPSPVARVPK